MISKKTSIEPIILPSRFLFWVRFTNQYFNSSFFLIISIQADDIKDFQIEGISIGDSLLNFYSKKDTLFLIRSSSPTELISDS